MKNVALPRPLADYFGFAELEKHGDTRRFSITLPYLCGAQLDRLQWWWRLTPTEEGLLGEGGLEARRQREIERFYRHVERWLANTRQRMCGDGPIPKIEALPATGTPEEGAASATDKESGPSPESDERRYA